MPRFLRRTPPVAPDPGALVAEHLEAGRPTGWFEPLYAGADRDPDAVPWAQQTPHPYVVDWLDDPVVTPPGRRAVVVGCGLGDDAAELARRDFDVVAFDVAPSAVAWAQRRFRRSPVDWRVVDLLELPDELVGAFGLVVEVRTVQSLPGVVRDAAMHAVGRLAAPGGVVLAVSLVASSNEVSRTWQGPPWAQAPSELAAYRAAGLERLALEHPDPDEHGAMEVRLTLQRPAGSVPPGAGLPIVPTPG
ncbi:class I SAM-dependent methyltransferase [Egicoccus halophilus]|uniref:Methyltransferase type 12 n=1 Tax=Egicoccus halophilus TaxID=1670830 RepID=A0A8J3AGI2_9ACTN|nr:class I SAM-dependent methyltransferase [Egicoccus halophilus]GGI08887.1 methyltransferase type 12 [Egicoccus halophilus]